MKKLEEISNASKTTHPVSLNNVATVTTTTKDQDDDDVDLFGSDSEEDEEALKVRQKRLADYEAKKSKSIAFYFILKIIYTKCKLLFRTSVDCKVKYYFGR